MKTVTTREAQHHLSQVLREVERGDDVLITRRGIAVARLTQVRTEEEPLSKEIDWGRVLEERVEYLAGLPDRIPGDSAELLRSEERF